MRGNLAWALGYNALLLPVAMGALVPVFGLGMHEVLPITGALAMALWSTSVVLNSVALRWVSLGSGRWEAGVARDASSQSSPRGLFRPTPSSYRKVP